MKTEVKTRRAPDKRTRTPYDFNGVTNSKQEKNLLFHFNGLSFNYETEDVTGIKNNMMQNKMQGTD